MTHIAAGQILATNFLDGRSLIESFGTVGVLLVLFAETGLLVGFFLPGDSMVFLAGVAASPAAAKIFHGTHLPLGVLMVGGPIAAIIGAQLGHFIGAKAGRALFNREDSRLFRREYVERAEHYFTRFGEPKAVVLARFVPIIRTFLNPTAGVLGMPARRFFVWNAVGGVLWVEGVLLLGYFLGDRLKGSIDKYLLPAVALIIVLSLVPIAVEIVRARRASTH